MDKRITGRGRPVNNWTYPLCPPPNWTYTLCQRLSPLSARHGRTRDSERTIASSSTQLLNSSHEHHFFGLPDLRPHDGLADGRAVLGESGNTRASADQVLRGDVPVAHQLQPPSGSGA